MPVEAKPQEEESTQLEIACKLATCAYCIDGVCTRRASHLLPVGPAAEDLSCPAKHQLIGRIIHQMEPPKEEENSTPDEEDSKS